MARFHYWPFRISAGTEGGTDWADRVELRKELDDLLLGVKPNRPSTLINVWAYYGAGKTYALRYLQHAAAAKGIWSIYSVTPKGAASFTDVYRSIVEELSDVQLLTLQDELQKSESDVGQSLYGSLRRISLGSPAQAALARTYLVGRRTTAAQRRDLNVIVDLQDSGACADALSLILAILGRSRGVLLLLDEVQDLHLMRDRALNETEGLLQQIFDEVQFGLRIVASFTTGVKDTISQVLGEALYHRASRLIEIPEFSEDEALQFLTELVARARADSAVNPFEPFSENEIRAMITSIRASGEKLVPRELIKGADNLFQSLGD